MPRRPAVAALALLGTALLAGCATSAAATRPASSPSPSAYTVVSTSSLTAGQPLPTPAGDVVLTIDGAVTRPNAGRSVQLDLATIERLGLVEFRVDDKQAEGKVVTFRGVLLSELLTAVGVPATATTLHTLALNDYAVDIPLSDVRRYPVLLATSVDGHRMPVARFGPVRIVYPTSSFSLDPTVYDPRWIWQLRTIEVR